MTIANTPQQFGLVSIVLHWLSAFIIFGLFALGLYMVELDYYSPWYHHAPHWHESIGLLFFGVMFIRVILRLLNPPPKPLDNLTSWEKKLALLVHRLFFILIFAILITGYFISTAGNKPVAIFDWLSLPAVTTNIEQQQDVAKYWHYRFACALIVLALLHTLAALKHHFVDKDSTLMRMIKPTNNNP